MKPGNHCLSERCQFQLNPRFREMRGEAFSIQVSRNLFFQEEVFCVKERPM